MSIFNRRAQQPPAPPLTPQQVAEEEARQRNDLLELMRGEYAVVSAVADAARREGTILYQLIKIFERGNVPKDMPKVTQALEQARIDFVNAVERARVFALNPKSTPQGGKV